MAQSTMRVNDRPLTRSECGTAGVLARLATEDWSEMTAAALSSPDHVSRLDRWVKRAREQNPRLNDQQAERLAEYLRREHYRRMGRLSAQARKLAREAQAEMDRDLETGAPSPAP
jgi:hypothetical protein